MALQQQQLPVGTGSDAMTHGLADAGWHTSCFCNLLLF